MKDKKFKKKNIIKKRNFKIKSKYKNKSFIIKNYIKEFNKYIICITIICIILLLRYIISNKYIKYLNINKYDNNIFKNNLLNNSSLTDNNNNEYYNYINVAYGFDNNYYYITHVSMKSLMLNQNKTTFIIFHIFVSKYIYNEQKPIIDKICYEHKNCKINYYQIGNEFNEFSPVGIRITRTRGIFYRLIIQNFLKNENKTFYFDCDTIINKDLTEMYNFNITDRYYIGQYEGLPIIKYGSHLRNFINSGVILINLDKLRKDNIYDKMIDFLRKNNNRLYFLDQDAVNVVCNEKNDFFPSNYISSGICDMKKMRNINLKRIEGKLNSEPFVFHFKGYLDKPWTGIVNREDIVCFDQITRFYEYARKSSYYYEILYEFKINIKKYFNHKLY